MAVSSRPSSPKSLTALKNKTKGEKMNRKNKRTVGSARFVTRAALIASLYVALSYVSSVFGLASGVIQFRISEALCILPIMMTEAIPGLFIGCLLANFVSGCLPWDIVFGSLATLIGAIGCYALRNLPEKLKWICTLPNLIANCLIVPIVLIKVYGVTNGYFYLMITVGIGELVCGVIGGTVLYYSQKK